MKFQVDQKVDYLVKLKYMYQQPNLTTKERLFLAGLIRKINSGGLSMQGSGNGWEKIYELVINTDSKRKMTLMEQFHKI